MAKPCKNKEDVIKRNMAYKRLCRINHWHPGLPPPELYGNKTKKTYGAYDKFCLGKWNERRCRKTHSRYYGKRIFRNEIQELF